MINKFAHKSVVDAGDQGGHATCKSKSGNFYLQVIKKMATEGHCIDFMFPGPSPTWSLNPLLEFNYPFVNENRRSNSGHIFELQLECGCNDHAERH